MLDQDPWKRRMELYVLSSREKRPEVAIETVPRSLDQLRSVHLLTHFKAADKWSKGYQEMHLVFQFVNDLKQVKLTKMQNKIHSVVAE